MRSAWTERIEKARDGNDTLFTLPDFRWLMAAVGWRVELSCLQHDLVYADECVQRGLASDCQPLRQRSAESQPLLYRLAATRAAITVLQPSKKET